MESSDPFSTNMNPSKKNQRKILGINTSDPQYSLGRWCYDTPGTIQPDQVMMICDFLIFFNVVLLQTRVRLLFVEIGNHSVISV